MTEPFSNYPKSFKVSTQQTESHYVRKEGLYAIQGEVPSVCRAAIHKSIEEGRIVVCKGNPDELPASVDRKAITPVYSLNTNGPLAVPTGLILIRYRNNIVAVRREAEIQHSGYKIDRPLAYAPQALWLKAANGDIAFALKNVSLLEAQADVVNVEPQMLMESVRREPGVLSHKG